MSLNGAETPQLILIQPLSLAFFMIDFNGPPMAANASDAVCLPDQAVADEKGRVFRQVSLAVVDNKALFTKL